MLVQTDVYERWVGYTVSTVVFHQYTSTAQISIALVTTDILCYISVSISGILCVLSIYVITFFKWISVSWYIERWSGWLMNDMNTQSYIEISNLWADDDNYDSDIQFYFNSHFFVTYCQWNIGQKKLLVTTKATRFLELSKNWSYLT